jgi:hypothetical protein
MNNATRESFPHSASPSRDNEREDPCLNDSGLLPGEEGNPEISEVIQRLKDIRLSPRPAVVADILRYAREKKPAAR